MTTIRLYLLFTFIILNGLFAQSPSDWKVDIGFRYFKFSAKSTPAEIQYNPVFEKWERINQSFNLYSIHDYLALKPLYFNMNFGFDFFIRFKNKVMIKLGYDYSNPFGIGGNGNITYTEKSTGIQYSEAKKFSYISHQINYYFGPLLQLDEKGNEFYIGFSPMSPTWVIYKEQYTLTENGNTTRNYNMKFTGFFGSCQALIGAQFSISKKFHLGSEAGFTFLNYMHLKSGEIEDNSFQFPDMKWNFTLRYEIF